MSWSGSDVFSIIFGTSVEQFLEALEDCLWMQRSREHTFVPIHVHVDEVDSVEVFKFCQQMNSVHRSSGSTVTSSWPWHWTSIRRGILPPSCCDDFLSPQSIFHIFASQLLTTVSWWIYRVMPLGSLVCTGILSRWGPHRSWKPPERAVAGDREEDWREDCRAWIRQGASNYQKLWTTQIKQKSSASFCDVEVEQTKSRTTDKSKEEEYLSETTLVETGDLPDLPFFAQFCCSIFHLEGLWGAASW